MRSHHQPGAVIADKYKILRILGEGYSGVTHWAKDLKNQFDYFQVDIPSDRNFDLAQEINI